MLASEGVSFNVGINAFDSRICCFRSIPKVQNSAVSIQIQKTCWKKSLRQRPGQDKKSAPGGNRTPNLRLRRPTLYPIEPLAQTFVPKIFLINIQFLLGQNNKNFKFLGLFGERISPREDATHPGTNFECLENYRTFSQMGGIRSLALGPRITGVIPVISQKLTKLST